MTSLKSTKKLRELDPKRDFRRFAVKVLATACGFVNSPVSSAVAANIASSDFVSLVSMKVDPATYHDPEAFRRDYQLVSLLKKADFLHTGIDREAKAVEKWVDAERRCAQTNDRLSRLVYHDGGDPELLAILNRMQDFIKRALGPAPRWRDLDYRFGPGATALVKRGITLPNKYGRTVCCTPRLVPFVHDIVGMHWSPSTLLVVDGNNLSFVPKTATIDRAICIEPDLNIYCQLAIGSAIRKRMARYFDLNMQAELNRNLVRTAQVLGLATIDLASASDTVASLLVSLVIPEDWLELMDACRCDRVTYKGTTLAVEKYSSMGNGYTFELETLIFYALARVLGADPKRLGVFGDDIIVDKELAPKMIEVLAKLGFETNNDKTFVSGSFYESCGVDVFEGCDVRPVFVKTMEGPSDYIKLVNDIQRMARPLGENRWLDPRYRTLFEQGCRLLRKHNLFYQTPLLLGDVGVTTPLDVAVPKSDTQGNFIFKAMKFRARTLDYGRKYTGYLASLDSGAREDVDINPDTILRSNHTEAFARLRRPHKEVAVRGEGEWSAVVHKLPNWQWDDLGIWL